MAWTLDGRWTDFTLCEPKTPRPLSPEPWNNPGVASDDFALIQTKRNLQSTWRCGGGFYSSRFGDIFLVWLSSPELDVLCQIVVTWSNRPFLVPHRPWKPQQWDTLQFTGSPHSSPVNSATNTLRFKLQLFSLCWWQNIRDGNVKQLLWKKTQRNKYHISYCKVFSKCSDNWENTTATPAAVAFWVFLYKLTLTA